MHDTHGIPPEQHEAFVSHIFQSLEFILGIESVDDLELEAKKVKLERKT
jgi:hypothetical protein